MKKVKLIRVTTVPSSLKVLLKDQLRFMSQYFDILAVSSSGKELHDVKNDELVRTRIVNMTREFTLLKDLISLLRMIKLFREEKPIIVHSHTPKAGIVSMLAGKICGIPIRLHTVAGLPLMEAAGLKRTILLIVEWVTCMCATRVYPNSIGLRDFLIEVVRVPENRLRVLGNGTSNGVDTKYFKLTPSISRKSVALQHDFGLNACFTFVFIGRIVRDKGVEELIDAFVKLTDEKPNVRLLIVGQEEPVTDPLSLRTKGLLQANKKIISAGYIDDIRPILGFSDCLVLPSYREGFPNVVLQAGCMGVPSIVSNINGCNEIITHGCNGFIVEPKSKSSLYDAMKTFASDSIMLRAMATKCREGVIDKFDRDEFHQILLNEYYKQLEMTRDIDSRIVE